MKRNRLHGRDDRCRTTAFTTIPALAGIIASAPAAAQPVRVSVAVAGMYLERGFCTPAPQVQACDASCGAIGSSFGASAYLQAHADASPDEPCTRWTLHAQGAMSGDLRQGQRIRLSYRLRADFGGGTLRLASASVAGSHGAADIVAAGVAPTMLAPGVDLVGTIETPLFRTSLAPGTPGGSWNVEFVVEWAPASPSPSARLQVPPGGVRVEVIGPGVPCEADASGDGALGPDDVAMFVAAWLGSLAAGDLNADFDHSGAVQPADVAAFVQAWMTAIGAGGCG